MLWFWLLAKITFFCFEVRLKNKKCDLKKPHKIKIYKKHTIVIRTLGVRISMVCSYGAGDGTLNCRRFAQTIPVCPSFLLFAVKYGETLLSQSRRKHRLAFCIICSYFIFRLCRSGRFLRHTTFIKNKEQTARACSLLLWKGYKKDIFAVLLTGFELSRSSIILFLCEFRPDEL